MSSFPKNGFNISHGEDRRSIWGCRRALSLLKDFFPRHLLNLCQPIQNFLNSMLFYVVKNNYANESSSAFEVNLVKLRLFGFNLVSHDCSSIIAKTLSKQCINKTIMNQFKPAELNDQLWMWTNRLTIGKHKFCRLQSDFVTLVLGGATLDIKRRHEFFIIILRKQRCNLGCTNRSYLLGEIIMLIISRMWDLEILRDGKVFFCKDFWIEFLFFLIIEKSSQLDGRKEMQKHRSWAWRVNVWEFEYKKNLCQIFFDKVKKKEHKD